MTVTFYVTVKVTYTYRDRLLSARSPHKYAMYNHCFHVNKRKHVSPVLQYTLTHRDIIRGVSGGEIRVQTHPLRRIVGNGHVVIHSSISNTLNPVFHSRG